jgi:ABC-type glycerol-3-phosphate transport system permease component
MLRRLQQPLLVLVLSIVSLLGIGPYLFMFLTAFKTNEQFYQSYFSIPSTLYLGNFISSWEQIMPYFINTVYIAAVSIIGVLVLATVSAYVLARYHFKAKNIIYISVVILLAVPYITSLVPLFILINDLGLINTRMGLIIPYIATGQVMAIFLMKTFFENLPQELFDSATLDGANGVRLFWSIGMPLSKPIILTVMMLTLINVWNDYIWPSVTVSENSMRTITVGLAFFQGQYMTDWGLLFAGYTIASIPLVLVFIVSMRYFVSGLTGGMSK